MNCPYCSRTLGFIYSPKRSLVLSCPYCNNKIALALSFAKMKPQLLIACIGAVVLWPVIGGWGVIIAAAFLILVACIMKDGTNIQGVFYAKF